MLLCVCFKIGSLRVGSDVVCAVVAREPAAVEYGYKHGERLRYFGRVFPANYIGHEGNWARLPFRSGKKNVFK